MPAEKSVLVIEDDNSIRQNLQMLFELEGFKVLLAEHGKEALEILEAHSLLPDVMLLDLMMPVMNGVEFVHALRNRARPELTSIPTIILSAAGDASRTADTLGLKLVKKPIELEELLQEVDRAINHRHSKAS